MTDHQHQVLHETIKLQDEIKALGNGELPMAHILGLARRANQLIDELSGAYRLLAAARPIVDRIVRQLGLERKTHGFTTIGRLEAVLTAVSTGEEQLSSALSHKIDLLTKHLNIEFGESAPTDEQKLDVCLTAVMARREKEAEKQSETVDSLEALIRDLGQLTQQDHSRVIMVRGVDLRGLGA